MQVNTIGLDLAKLRLARHLLLARDGGNDAWRCPCPNPQLFKCRVLAPKGRHVSGSARCYGGFCETCRVGGGQRQRLAAVRLRVAFASPLWPQGSNWQLAHRCQ